MRAWVVLLLACVLSALPRDARGQTRLGDEIEVATGAELASVAMGARRRVRGDVEAHAPRAGQSLFGQVFDRQGRRRGRPFQVSDPSLVRSAGFGGHGRAG